MSGSDYAFRYWFLGIATDIAVPSTGTPTATDTATINIVGNNGSQSFSPNPAQLSSNVLVKWHNGNTVTHRILLDDGSFDSWLLSTPGTDTSAILAVGATYHCVIHPSMVGTISVLPP